MAGALVGGALLSATLQVLFDRLASREVINVFRGRKDGDRLLKRLKLSLLGLNAVLNDAENKQITNPAVKEWVEELKDVIYHADDLVDEIATEALRSKSEADYQSSSSSTSRHSRLSQPRSNKTMEEVGNECLDELLSMSLFQPSARESCFVMHDLVNDLAQSVSGDFCLRLENDKPHIIADKVRHFSYARGTFDDFQRFKVINEAKFLRTFLPLGRRYFRNWLSKMVLNVILSRLICLRVLSLPHYRIFELPHSIGNLIHLRYLDLSHTQILQLPESVCNLYNLQTLLLIDCYNLTTLPTEIGKLILLRHLDISGTAKLREMPMQMSRLKDLQTLTAFVVGKCSCSGINELKEFHHLRGSLSISCLQNITSCTDAMEAKLKEKKFIGTLVLSWDSGNPNDSESERDVLDKLQPHTNLKHLEVNRYRGTRFPEWLGDQSFCNMVSLSLQNCEDCFFLPLLGQLPSLKHLTISGMPSITKVGPEFYGDCSLSKPFQSLETLSFSKMLDWEEWYILDDGEFSRLQELRVTNCPKLIGGLPKHIPSWVRVEIRDCPGLMASLPRTCAANQLVLQGCNSVELGWQGLSSLVNLEISSASLKELTPKLYTLIYLKALRIERCPDLLLFPDTRLPPMLTNLTIIDCRAICCLPERVMRLNSCLKHLIVRACPKLVFPLSEEMVNCYTSLESLSLATCDTLSSLPLGLFPKLQSLNIENCRNFVTLSTLNGLGFQNFTSLEWLYLDGCSNMESFSQQVLIAPNLKSFGLWNCKKLKSLPDRMHSLTSLQSLSIWNCPGIESFLEGGLPSSLHGLEIRNCAKLVARRREWGLQRLPSLTSFYISGEYEEDVLESFPEEGLLPSTLIWLEIKDVPNLKSLNNRGLQHLASLKNMRIAGCAQLQSLPEEGLPTSLFLLEISKCPLLKPRCLREEGQDWHKIARIPLLHTDSELSFDQRTLAPTQHYSLFYIIW
ncbi:hypothetical protein TEA_019526 [Camellia sinensis var. sinensis]|uniref:Uncharacterized protein n=1 Tax=Camellia sinensis var. sinensis TaxID=542762 RepID=A0A4S4F2L9_CAMSN|nr:hypothetical protein TEA_019526 [Camellia sinensis var. sinensis]